MLQKIGRHGSEGRSKRCGPHVAIKTSHKNISHEFTKSPFTFVSP